MTATTIKIIIKSIYEIIIIIIIIIMTMRTKSGNNRKIYNL